MKGWGIKSHYVLIASRTFKTSQTQSPCLYLLHLSRVKMCCSCFSKELELALRMSIGARVNSRLHIIALWRAATQNAPCFFQYQPWIWMENRLSSKKRKCQYHFCYILMFENSPDKTAANKELSVSLAAASFKVIFLFFFPLFSGCCLRLVSTKTKKKKKKRICFKVLTLAMLIPTSLQIPWTQDKFVDLGHNFQENAESHQAKLRVVCFFHPLQRWKLLSVASVGSGNELHRSLKEPQPPDNKCAQPTKRASSCHVCLSYLWSETWKWQLFLTLRLPRVSRSVCSGSRGNQCTDKSVGRGCRGCFLQR